MTTFADLGVPAELTKYLESQGITEPFPIQEATIPDGLEGLDICGRAPTGSGKTLAFGIPMVADIGKASSRRPRGLVLAPTRELAEQISRELAPMAKLMDRRVHAVYGGVGYEPQKKALRKGVDILIACPGRLVDLINQKDCELGDVDYVVIDEADRMADMGFLPEVKRLLDQTSKHRQTVLFSATLDKQVQSITKAYQHKPVRHEIGPERPDITKMDHLFWSVTREDRVEVAARAIRSLGSTIVFSRTRHGADRIARQLGKFGIDAVPIHGGRSQGQRTRALEAFTSYKAEALIATDVAARGIHIDEVAGVIHFDPPEDDATYVHRSGRTARAGASGVVISLLQRNQEKDARQMQRKLDLDVAISPPFSERLEGGEWVTVAVLEQRAKTKPIQESGRDGQSNSRSNGNGQRSGSGRSSGGRGKSGGSRGSKSKHGSKTKSSGGGAKSGGKRRGPKQGGQGGQKQAGPKSSRGGSNRNGSGSGGSKRGGKPGGGRSGSSQSRGRGKSSARG